jgi:hypothetical protein
MARASPEGCSGREALPALRAPIRQDLAAADRRGPGEEAVPTLPDELRGLVGTLHDTLPPHPLSRRAVSGRPATRRDFIQTMPPAAGMGKTQACPGASGDV